MVSDINIPDVSFPIVFRQRVDDKSRRTFRLSTNTETDLVEIDIIRDEDTIAQGRPVVIGNPIGKTVAEADYIFYATDEERRTDVDVTESKLRDGEIVIRAVSKDDV